MRREKRPTPIADLIGRFLAETEGEPNRRAGARTVRVFSAFQRIGPPVTEHAEPIHYRQGVLTLLVADSGWLTELTFLKPQILQRMGAELGKDTVKDLRIRLGPRIRTAPAVPRPRPLSPTQRAAVDGWASAIPDPDVRAAMIRAAERSVALGPRRGSPMTGPAGPRLAPKPPEHVAEPAFSYGFAHREVDKFKGVDRFGEVDRWRTRKKPKTEE